MLRLANRIRAERPARRRDAQRPVRGLRWHAPNISFNPVRSSSRIILGLVIYSKRVTADAELHIAEAVETRGAKIGRKEEMSEKKQTQTTLPRNGAQKKSERF